MSKEKYNENLPSNYEFLDYNLDGSISVRSNSF